MQRQSRDASCNENCCFWNCQQWGWSGTLQLRWIIIDGSETTSIGFEKSFENYFAARSGANFVVNYHDSSSLWSISLKNLQNECSEPLIRAETLKCFWLKSFEFYSFMSKQIRFLEISDGMKGVDKEIKLIFHFFHTYRFYGATSSLWEEESNTQSKLSDPAYGRAEKERERGDR